MKNGRVTVTLLLALTFALLPSRSVAQGGPVEWVRTNAIRLQTPQAGSGFDDMQPLKALIGDARIVSLGESTHGTREFFQLKHRMLEFLATEMGFTIFSIEANMPEAYRLNDYVLHGRGDPAQLLAGMYFWTWNTQEVLEMIHWMREFNASGKGRVQFTGFDMQTDSVAVRIVREFVDRYDPGYADELTAAVGAIPGRGAAAPAFGVASGTISAAPFAGRTIRFSGYIRTQDVTDGYAGLWVRVDGPPGTQPLAFDNMQSRGARGTTGWRQFTIQLPVAANATRINLGMLMPGGGTAWFDDLSIAVDGQPIDTAMFDLTFESGALRGFAAGGNGYRVQLDNTVAHGGRWSLRMTRVSVPVSTGDPRGAVTTWNRVIAHLQAQRSAYVSRGAPAWDVEWAVQNARVVVQAIQSRANLVSRDRSMAMNVKWILDQNPGAKIVLWAHNGHVARGQMMFRSMGQELHQLYGTQMIVFGFAFNRGSFQAIGADGGGVQEFTVGPAPDGGFDSMLGSAGIPVFALDLRKAPAWFSRPRTARQIGSMYSHRTAAQYRSTAAPASLFDAVLFVENTTRARPNTGSR